MGGGDGFGARLIEEGGDPVLDVGGHVRTERHVEVKSRLLDHTRSAGEDICEARRGVDNDLMIAVIAYMRKH